jgi:hypothetical protein
LQGQKNTGISTPYHPALPNQKFPPFTEATDHQGEALDKKFNKILGILETN